MITPEFQPAQAPGAAMAAFRRGLDTSVGLADAAQSFMDRATRRRLALEAAELERREHELLAPARQARADADRAAFNAQVTGLAQAEAMRQAASELAPEARKAFAALVPLTDATDREQRSLEWVYKYGHLAGIAGYEQEWRGLKDIVANFQQEAQSLRLLSQRAQASGGRALPQLARPGDGAAPGPLGNAALPVVDAPAVAAPKAPAPSSLPAPGPQAAAPSAAAPASPSSPASPAPASADEPVPTVPPQIRF